MRALGEFEQLVLWSILRLGEDAYGVPIGREIEERTGRTVSPGALYTALGRMEDRGLVESRTESGDEIRSGRPRKYYTPTPRAARELLASRERIARMAEGQNATLTRLLEGAEG